MFRGNKEELATFGSGMVTGYQEEGVAATVKHFPGHSDLSPDSHKQLPISSIPPESLHEFTSIFREVIRSASPELLMTSPVLFANIDPRYPATLSPYVISYVRNNLGFSGVIITDDMNMGAIAETFGREEAAIQALAAGNDMLLYVVLPNVFDGVYASVLKAAESGQIPEARIDESVRRILTLKKKLGSQSSL